MTPRYDPIARSLHWLIALMILGSFALGLYMHELPLSPQKLKLYSWHKWAGVSIFLLVLGRAAWRITHRPPPLPSGMTALQKTLAGAGHGLLYLLMFAIPLSGWLMSSAKGFQTVWFGILPLPDLVAKDADLGDALRSLHEALNLLLALSVAGHVLMALKHHFIDKDGLLLRMAPGKSASR